MRTVLCIALWVVVYLSACHKDGNNTDCKRLEGTWTATAWWEDNEQFLGDTLFISSSVLEFNVLDGDQGDIEWNIGYTLGGDENIIGSYLVNDDCNKVTITPKAGVGTTYDFIIDGDVLTLETNDNNVHVVQEYQRN